MSRQSDFLALCERAGIDPDSPTARAQASDYNYRQRPCVLCQRSGARRALLVCDVCVADAEARRPERRPVMAERVASGRYQDDGLGCVEKVHPLERMWEER